MPTIWWGRCIVRSKGVASQTGRAHEHAGRLGCCSGAEVKVLAVECGCVSHGGALVGKRSGTQIEACAIASTDMAGACSPLEDSRGQRGSRGVASRGARLTVRASPAWHAHADRGSKQVGRVVSTAPTVAAGSAHIAYRQLVHGVLLDCLHPLIQQNVCSHEGRRGGGLRVAVQRLQVIHLCTAGRYDSSAMHACIAASPQVARQSLLSPACRPNRELEGNSHHQGMPMCTTCQQGGSTPAKPTGSKASVAASLAESESVPAGVVPAPAAALRPTPLAPREELGVGPPPRVAVAAVPRANSQGPI